MSPPALRFPDRPAGATELNLDLPRIVGILNVTPDSFSDGGRYDHLDAAVAHGRAMTAQGAAIIDIGGESTRPGAPRIGVDEQVRRVVPVVAALRAMLDAEFPQVVISVDTTRAAVAAAALDAGASMLNDVSAGREDPEMLALAAARGTPIVLMHMRGEPGTMQDAPRYDDVVAEVSAFLAERAAAAEAAGVAASQVVLDPGIGFGKTLDHNLALLAALPELVRLRAAASGTAAETSGGAVLLGTSRKSMFARLDPTGAAVTDRLPGTLATTALAVAAGVRLIRVHDVAENVQAAAVAYRISRLGPTRA